MYLNLLYDAYDDYYEILKNNLSLLDTLKPNKKDSLVEVKRNQIGI